ncbi:tape measure protein [Mycobacterium phage Acolyte]|nr:tape measure protein [Mycobacterium phage Acolyte]
MANKAGMATGVEVARISVKVSPDTKAFRRELKKDLDEIEQSMRGTVHVDAKLDTKGLSAKMAGEMAKLKSMASDGVDVDVNVDKKGGFGAAFRDLGASLKSGFAAAGDARRAINGFRQELNQMTADQQAQQPLLNHSLAWWRNVGTLSQRGAGQLREFNGALRQQQQWLRESDPELGKHAARWKSWGMAIRDADTNATKSLLRMKSSFSNLMDGIKGGGGGGKRGGILGSILGGSGGKDDSVNEIGKAAKNAEKLGDAMGFLKGHPDMTWGSMLGIIAAVAAPLVGLVAGLLAGLPSLISAFGAGIGVVALGMDGIKKAAETITPYLDKAKEAVSSTFQQGLTPVMEQLGVALTAITPNLQNVAGGLVNMAKGVTDVITKGPGLQQIQNILDKTGEFFTGLTPVIQTGAQAFLTLANAGANSFGQLLAPLQQFATGFNDMVNRVTSNGVFEGAMQGLSQTLGSLLNLFNRLMETGLQAMSQLGGPLSTFVNGFGDLFTSLMPAFTSFSSLVGNVLGTLGTQLAPIMTALTPAFTTLANTVGTLLTGALQTLGTVLTPVAELIGGVLNTALQTLQPLLPPMIASFQQLATSVVSQLAPYLPQLATAFGQVLGAVVSLIPSLVGALIPAIQQLLPSIVSLVPSIVSMAQSFASMMPTLVPLVQILISLAAAVIQAGASIASFLISGLSHLMNILAECQAQIDGWVASWASGVQQVSDYVGQLPGKIKGWFDDAGSWLIEAGKNVVQGLINGIGSMIGSAISKAKELASGVKNAVTDFLGIHSPSKVFEQLGQFTGQGFGIGLDKGFAPVLQQAKDLAAQLSQTMQAGTDPSQILADAHVNKAELKQMLAALEEERKRLQVQKDQIPKSDKAGRSSLQNQLDQIKAQKDILSYQQDRLKNEKAYGKAAGEDPLVKATSGLAAAPVNFAKATGKQFLSDIGIGGDGFISKAITEGISYVFNIGSVDEALQVKDREESKNALSVVGRQ